MAQGDHFKAVRGQFRHVARYGLFDGWNIPRSTAMPKSKEKTDLVMENEATVDVAS